MLSRALCRFIRIDLSRLPANKRASALNLQLPQWSPYRDSGYAVAWSDGVASVWCWDQAPIDAALVARGLKPHSLRKIPETLLRPRQAEGFSLLACLDGFEGQCWGASQLLASRWWPALPDAAALLAFQRDANLPLDQQLTTALVQDLALQARPWAAFGGARADVAEVSTPEMLVYSLLALALGLPAMAMGVDQYRLGQAIAARQAEIARLSEQSKPLLDARDTALAALQQIKALDALQPFPSPLVLMVAVARALPEAVFLKEWEMSDGQLKILVSSPEANISGSAYVSALEQSRLFADIKMITQPEPKQMGFAMGLRSQQALSLEAPAAASPEAAESLQPARQPARQPASQAAKASR